MVDSHKNGGVLTALPYGFGAVIVRQIEKLSRYRKNALKIDERVLNRLLMVLLGKSRKCLSGQYNGLQLGLLFYTHDKAC